MNKNTIIIVAVVLIIIAAAGGFYAGMKYQGNKIQSAFAGRNGNFQRFGGQTGQNANFRAVRGQVLSMGSNTMTVKLNNGSTEIIVLSNNTTYGQSQKASLGDLKTGDTVNVVGTSNSDGSVTAQDVQINPQAIQRPSGSPSAQ